MNALEAQVMKKIEPQETHANIEHENDNIKDYGKFYDKSLKI